MKMFLTTSIVAMIAAGIFGIYDFSNDIKHGNYIVYEQEDETANISSESAGRNSKAMNLNNVASVVKEEFEATTKKVVKEEYFSRGEPIEMETVVPQQAKALPEKAEPAKAIEKIETVEKRVEKPSKRKFSYSLYSRGRPPKIVEEEVVVATADSTKKE